MYFEVPHSNLANTARRLELSRIDLSTKNRKQVITYAATRASALTQGRHARLSAHASGAPGAFARGNSSKQLDGSANPNPRAALVSALCRQSHSADPDARNVNGRPAASTPLLWPTAPRSGLWLGLGLGGGLGSGLGLA